MEISLPFSFFDVGTAINRQLFPQRDLLEYDRSMLSENLTFFQRRIVWTALVTRPTNRGRWIPYVVACGSHKAIHLRQRGNYCGSAPHGTHRSRVVGHITSTIERIRLRRRIV